MLIEVLKIIKRCSLTVWHQAAFCLRVSDVWRSLMKQRAVCSLVPSRSRRDVWRHRRSSEETLCGSGSGAAARSHESELGELVQDPGAAGSFLVCIPASERSAVRRRRAGGAGGAGAHRRSGEHRRWRLMMLSGLNLILEIHNYSISSAMFNVCSF